MNRRIKCLRPLRLSPHVLKLYNVMDFGDIVGFPHKLGILGQSPFLFLLHKILDDLDLYIGFELCEKVVFVSSILKWLRELLV